MSTELWSLFPYAHLCLGIRIAAVPGVLTLGLGPWHWGGLLALDLADLLISSVSDPSLSPPDRKVRRCL